MLRQDQFVADANQYPLRKRNFEVFAKSDDERLMVKIHKANIRAQSLALTGNTKWEPSHKLVFTF